MASKKDPMSGMRRDPMENFFSAVEVLDNGCWQWTRSLITEGYGKFSIRSTQIAPHRFSYLVFRGDIPYKYHLDHLCRNRGCVNPDHLEAVTTQENIMRGIGMAVINRAKTACPKGHSYTNINRKGHRLCRICVRERRRQVQLIEQLTNILHSVRGRL